MKRNYNFSEKALILLSDTSISYLWLCLRSHTHCLRLAWVSATLAASVKLERDIQEGCETIDWINQHVRERGYDPETYWKAKGSNPTE